MKNNMSNKPPSKCTVKDLLKHIEDTTGGKDLDKWYVMVNEHEGNIELINSETSEKFGIKACERCYRAEKWK